MNSTVVVVGSGGLARGVCHSLALAPIPITVHVLARRPEMAAEVVTLAAMRARLGGSPVRFTAGSDVRRSLAGLRPRVVVNCASHQSPWERRTRPSAWTELLRRGGFGLTLPLQAEPAIRLARVIAAESPDTVLLNGCFPDAANPVLAALGLPVFCGIGNVTLLAAALQATLPAGPRPLRVLAHHVHLHEPSDERDEALAWQGDDQLSDVSTRLAALRATNRQELNAVTGHTAALLVQNLVTGADTRISVPGPLGLPGGYPVRVSEGALSLDLPAGLSEAEAVDRNERSALQDGVAVRGSAVVFGDAAREALRPHLPDLAAGFRVHEITDVCERFLGLRDRLRASTTSEEERWLRPVRPGT